MCRTLLFSLFLLFLFLLFFLSSFLSFPSFPSFPPRSYISFRSFFVSLLLIPFLFFSFSFAHHLLLYLVSFYFSFLIPFFLSCYLLTRPRTPWTGLATNNSSWWTSRPPRLTPGSGSRPRAQARSLAAWMTTVGTRMRPIRELHLRGAFALQPRALCQAQPAITRATVIPGAPSASEPTALPDTLRPHNTSAEPFECSSKTGTQIRATSLPRTQLRSWTSMLSMPLVAALTNPVQVPNS